MTERGESFTPKRVNCRSRHFALPFFSFLFFNFWSFPDRAPTFCLKARPNECNMLVQHRPKLLNPTCCDRLATMLYGVA